MKKQILSPTHQRRATWPLPGKEIIATTALAAFACLANAQTVGFTADPVNTQFGTYQDSNGGLLNIGRTMTVSGAGIEVFQLGVFDYQSDGLAAAHTVTLFNADNQTVLASVTVPAGMSTPLINAYRFAPLATPLFLPAGNYALVAYQLNHADPYGNGNAPGFNGYGNVSPGAGIYSFTSAASPAYTTDTTPEYFASVSFTYTNVAAGSGVWTGNGANNNWSTAGNWNVALGFPADVIFAGNTRLANNNDLTGITVNSLKFDSAAGPFVLGGNDITLAGDIGFFGVPAVPITQTVNLNLAWNGSSTVDIPTNGNLTLAGAITGVNDFTKVGDGSLTLGGTDTFSGFYVNGGTNVITGNVTVNGTGGSRFYLGNANAAYNGTMVIQPGAVFSVTGGFADSFVIGRDAGSGKLIQNGGTFSFSPSSGADYLFVGATGYKGTTSEYDMNGGVLDMNGKSFGVALGANGIAVTGVVNQVGGVITNVGTLALSTFFAPGYSIINLTGGSFYIGAGGVTTVGGYEINLGGGTVGAYANWTSPLNMNLTGNNGPVTFDTADNTITLSGVLSGNGGFAKVGNGTLELSGVNTFKGDMAIKAGTLLLDGTGSSSGALRISNGATVNLNYVGTYVVGSLYTNGVALPVGTYNAGNLPGYIVGYGDLQVASSISTGLWDGGGADGNWSTRANWDQDAVPVFPIGLTFAGNKHLANNNNLDSVIVSSVTFDTSAGAFVLSGNPITLSGHIGFNGNPSTTITQAVNFDMTWTADKAIDTPTNGNLTLGGAVSSSYTLTKTDAGVLTLGGTDYFAGMIVNGGTTRITGNVGISGLGNNYFFLGNTTGNGTLIIENGAMLSVYGSFGDNFVIGRDGGSGKVIQNGGTFSYAPDKPYLFVAATGNPATQAEYDMNGGVLDMNGKVLVIAYGAGTTTTGIVNQVGGLIDNVYQVGFYTPALSSGSGHGVYNLSGGRINIAGGGIASSSGTHEINLGGGTIGALDYWASSLDMNLTNLNGSVTFDTAANSIILSGVLSGNGGLIKIGSGILELSGANSYKGDTVINEGTLQLDNTGTGFGALRLAKGTTLNLNYSGVYVVPTFYVGGVALASGTYTASNLPEYITGGGELHVNSISTGLWQGNGANSYWSAAANWDGNTLPIFPIGLTFAGSQRLVNTNDLAAITASSITFDAAAGPFVLNGNDVALTGSIGFNGNPAAPVTQTVNNNLAWNGSSTFDIPANGNLNLAGAITGVSDLTKVGNGTLTLGGTDAFSGFYVNGGTNVITGNVTVNGTGGSRFYLGNASAAYNGTMVIQPGAVFSVTGGFADSFVIGRDGGSGKLIQNGGTFSYNPSSGADYLFVGATGYKGTTSEYDMNGGVLDMNGKSFGVALGANNTVVTGMVNQVGGVITNVSTLALSTFFAPGYSIINLTGGSFYIGAGGVTTTGGYEINLGGGTVGAYASWTSSLNMKLTGNNGPVTFDTADNAIMLSGVLSGNGGLTKVGNGTLELSGANTFQGDVTIKAGTLQLDVAGSNAGAVRIASGATLSLNFTGTKNVSGLFTDNVALPSGVYNSGNLPGFITGTGSLNVGNSIPGTPTTITLTVSPNSLTMSWPAAYKGCILQAQTNTLSVGLSNNWVDVAGSADVTSLTLPITTTNPTTFYRLRHP